MNPNGWDGKALAEVSDLLNTVTSSNFLAAFETTRYLLGFTQELSSLLQKPSLDIVKASNEITLVKCAGCSR